VSRTAHSAVWATREIRFYCTATDSRVPRRWETALIVAIGMFASMFEPAHADEAPDELAKKLANPVASLISVPLQLNWDTGLAENGLGSKWLLNIQPVIPISLSDHWNLISRTIVPLAALSDVVPGKEHQSGLADITQSFFFSPKEPVGGWIIGAGPALLVPSATDPSLGNGKWGLGPTLVVLRQTSNGLTTGILWNHIWSFAGSGNRPDLNATFLQPFVAKGMGNGITVNANLESSYDWEGRHWVVPFNLSATKVTMIGHQRVSLGGGVRYYFTTPAGGPNWGVRLVVTLLYPK
jgi:hypothetical protein